MSLEPQDARLLCLAQNSSRKINSVVRAVHQLTHVGIATTIKKKIQRPISLLNVDTKISSKVLAKRLEHILPDLILYNQNAYVKVRLIFDSIRTIDDVLEYTKQRRQSGIMVTIDFEKVFDSLDHEFLVKVHHTIYFGTSFTQWIRTFYSNV